MFCDLPEITEEALTRKLAATAATEGEAATVVGPSTSKQSRCILSLVTQTFCVYARLLSYLCSSLRVSFMFAFC
jgi:hypothetical protein